MTASLTYCQAMSELIEHNLESADPAQLQKPVIMSPKEIDDLLYADDFEVLQEEAEHDMMMEMQERREHRLGRSLRSAW